MKKFFGFYALLMITLGLISCDNDKSEVEIPMPSGDIIGKVMLYDIFEKEVSDKSAVTVEALTGGQKFTTTTNSAGEFSFSKVPQGDYIINFHKENFMGFDSLRFEHQNEVDSLFFAQLAEVPKGSTFINEINVDNPFNAEHPLVFPSITAEVESEEWILSSRWIFFSTDPNVSDTNFMYRYRQCCLGGNVQRPSRGSDGLEFIRFYETGFKPGDLIYVVSYLGHSLSMYYHNPAMGYEYYRFTSYGSTPSNVVSFTMP